MKQINIYLKNLMLLLIPVIVINSTLKAQKFEDPEEYKTLFGNNITYGGYGAFSIGYTKIGKYSAFSPGFEGAWIIGHGVAIGFSGNGFITELTTENLPDEEYSLLSGGSGGFLIEPILFGLKPIHVTIPIVIGAGTIGLEKNLYDNGPYHDHYHNPYSEHDEYLMIEPGLEVELNITRFFRIAVGGSYRFTSNVDLQIDNENEKIAILEDTNLNGFNFSIGFKFGKF